jgi:hypothetical protein
VDKDQEGEGSLYEGTDDNRFVFFSVPGPWTTNPISRGELITYPNGSGSITLVFLFFFFNYVIMVFATSKFCSKVNIPCSFFDFLILH